MGRLKTERPGCEKEKGDLWGPRTSGLRSKGGDPRGSQGVTLLPRLLSQMFLYNSIGQRGISISIGEETALPWGPHEAGLGAGREAQGMEALSLTPGGLTCFGFGGGSLSSLTGRLVTTSVMLIISGALVNGPYALITTAVSADLVSGATWGWARASVARSIFPMSLPTPTLPSPGLQR